MSDGGARHRYSLLGRSGLRVSPLCLGAMTFGTDWGWGSPEDTVRRMIDRYRDAGGNFIDTANRYTNGTSETLIGRYLAAAGPAVRDRLVLATKFTLTSDPSDPNAGGNGRKNIRQALEASLRRLQTDYVDLYWLHVWDGITPVEEVMETLHHLVASGKVRYIGLSDTPAWYLARAQTLAEERHWARVAALQLEYSLVERNIEREHIPAALEMGMAVTPWSPLAGGFLAGKYSRDSEGQGRLSGQKGTGGLFDRFSERNWEVLEVLRGVAGELDRPPAQVAINWVARRPGVASTIIGATSEQQLDANLAALDFDIPAELSARLEEASRPVAQFPHTFFRADNPMVNGDTLVTREPSGFRG